MHLRRNRFDIGERIGEAHRASGDGHSHVEKWDSDCSAAALVDANVAGKSCDEFLALSFVLQAGRIGFGI